jgi:hypothetical protein
MLGSETYHGERLTGNGQTNTVLPTGADQFYVSPEERKDWGIGDNEQVAWIRNPDEWRQHEKQDRGREYVREGHMVGEERRVVMVNGHPITNGDLILATYSGRREEPETSEKFLDQVDKGDVEQMPRFRANEIDRDFALRQHDYHRESGLIGPTGGMPASMVIQHKGAEAVRAEQARYRAGATHIDMTEDAERRVEQLRDRKGKQQYGGFDKSGFPGTLPTAQRTASARQNQSSQRGR